MCVEFFFKELRVKTRIPSYGSTRTAEDNLNRQLKLFHLDYIWSFSAGKYCIPAVKMQTCYEGVVSKLKSKEHL